MDTIKRYLDRFIFSEELPFEARVLNMVCTVGFIATLLSVVAHVVEQSSWIIGIIKVVMLVSILILLYVSNRFNLYIQSKWVTVVVFCDVLFPLIFIANGGVHSGISAYFVLSTIVIVLLCTGRSRIVILLTHFVIVGACYWLNYAHPEMIVPITEYQQYVDSIITFLITGAFIGFVILIQNHMYQLEKEKASMASKAKGDFLAQMSHEMRTPMNAIIGMSAIASATDDPVKRERSIAKIEEASQHLLGVINDILDMSKIEAGKMQLDNSDFDFKKMLDRVVNVNTFRIREKNQRFIIDRDEHIPPHLRGDSQRLAQVITNLLSNASKFTPEEGEIRLRAALKGETDTTYTLEIQVTDTGIGISEEQLSRLFNPFEQADNSTSREYGGTGLGLTISKNIADAMGGSLNASSILGAGSTFTFTATVGKANTQDRLTSAGATEDAPFELSEDEVYADSTILIAEDIDVNREIILAVLEPTQIHIDCAQNGKEAVRLFAAHPERYNLIFMDIQMPEMDGYEATRSIRAMSIPPAASVPLIDMTAIVFREDVEPSLAAGMNGHIGKPLDIKEVYTQLRTYLRPLQG
ncbi:MAG: response regulator [Coriobacteriales bacterium]|nr:response regulator [Coriobacteriales bacterium]